MALLTSHSGLYVDRVRTIYAGVPQRAQSFEINSNNVLDSISLYLCRQGGYNYDLGNVEVSLHAVDEDGFPTGAALSTGITSAADLLPSVNAGVYGIPEYSYPYLVSIPMTAYSIVADTVYAIVITTTNFDPGSVYVPPYLPTNTVGWMLNTTSSYDNGKGMRDYQVADPKGWQNDPNSYDYFFAVYSASGETAPTKPTNPSPTNGSGPGIDFTDFTLSWSDGGGAETYDVFIGPSGGLQKVSSAQIPTTYVTNASEIPHNQKVYWRVDATNANGTTTGDVWNFDVRPAQAINPVPANAATNQILRTGAKWDASSAATAYDFYVAEHDVGLILSATDVTANELASIAKYFTLEYDTQYDWRIDAKNQFGITQGDVWTFSTIAFDPPVTSWKLIPGGSGRGPYDFPPGIEGVDWQWYGGNNMVTVKRIVVAANGRIWFEEV